MYKIKVKDEFDGREYTGTFHGSKPEAINEAKLFYAQELDTTLTEIEVVEVLEII